MTLRRACGDCPPSGVLRSPALPCVASVAVDILHQSKAAPSTRLPLQVVVRPDGQPAVFHRKGLSMHFAHHRYRRHGAAAVALAPLAAAVFSGTAFAAPSAAAISPVPAGSGQLP